MSEHDDDLPEPVDIDGPRQVVRTGSPRTRLLVLGAVAALLVGALALADQQGGDPPDPDPEDEEEDTELDLEPSVLQLAGPRDGNESIGLPITVEPAVGLDNGQEVTATSGGFVPGEGVGIVQCADAAPDEPGDAIDLCNIDGYTSLTASSDGIASGTYEVRRTLVTPRSGTVDCAVEVRRCFIAMGAISDYDRSGGFEIEFLLETTEGSTAPPPPAVVGPPSASAVPALGLADGDVVQLTASGLVEGERLQASLCAFDPDVCWPLTAPEPAGDDPLGLVVAPGGYLDVPLQVWRFLPGPRPGTYVDCALSYCRIHLTGGTVPDPLILGFAGDEDPPTGPSFTVEPAEDLAIGDDVTIAGTGFLAGATVRLELCDEAAEPESSVGCTWLVDEPTDELGVFRLDATVPDLTDAPCSSCVVRATVVDRPARGRPTFVAAPVPVTFRRAE